MRSLVGPSSATLRFRGLKETATQEDAGDTEEPGVGKLKGVSIETAAELHGMLKF